MSPVVRQILSALILVVFLAVVVFVIARFGKSTAGIGAAIGIVVALIAGVRARKS